MLLLWKIQKKQLKIPENQLKSIIGINGSYLSPILQAIAPRQVFLIISQRTNTITCVKQISNFIISYFLNAVYLCRLNTLTDRLQI